MSIAVENNKERYMALMQEFATSSIDGKTFQKMFLDMHRIDLKQDDELKEKWPQRYDRQLIEARLRGNLSSEEFSKKWHQLFNTKWLDVFDRLFRDVDRFEPDPVVYAESKKESDPYDASYYITEVELKEKVNAYLGELKQEMP